TRASSDLAIIFVPHYVVFVKLFKTGVHDPVAIRVVKMLKNEPGKAGQKCARFFPLVYVLQDLFAMERVALPELFGQRRGHIFAEVVNYDTLTDIRSRPFISEYPPQVGYVVYDLHAIVEAGVGSGSQHTGSPRRAAPWGTRSRQQVPSDFHRGIGKESPEGLLHGLLVLW